MSCSILICLILFCIGYKSISFGPGSYSKQAMLGYRGLFAILIVTDHLSQEVAHPGLMWPFAWCGYLVVSLFFALSGYGLAVQTVKSNGAYLNGFCRKRLPRLWLPFWLCNGVYVLFAVLTQKLSFWSFETIGSVFGIPLINPNGWFVVALSFFYCFYFIAVRFWGKGSIRKGLPLLCVLLLGYGVVCYFAVEKIWWFNASFAFAMGIMVQQYPDFFQRLFRSTPGMIVVACLFWLNLVWGWKAWRFQQEFLCLFCMMVASTLCVILFFFVAGRVRLCGKVSCFLGTISYEIYLMHNLFRHFFKETVPIGTGWLYYLVTLCATLATAYGIHVIEKRIRS